MVNGQKNESANYKYSICDKGNGNCCVSDYISGITFAIQTQKWPLFCIWIVCSKQLPRIKVTMLINEMVPPAVTLHTSFPSSLRSSFLLHFVLGMSHLPFSISTHPSLFFFFFLLFSLHLSPHNLILSALPSPPFPLPVFWCGCMHVCGSSRCCNASSRVISNRIEWGHGVKDREGGGGVCVGWERE